MRLDIRLPLGLSFLSIGAILSVYGFFTRGDTTLYERSMGVNLNLGWGLLMVLFGLLMLWLGRRHQG